MLKDIVEFFPDIQSINSTENGGLVLFSNTEKVATSVQQQLLQDFKIPSVLDIDNDGAYCVVPLENIDEKTLYKFIGRGWQWYRNQKFVQYLITLYNKDCAYKIFNILVACGYNVILAPNNMQIIVKCLENSQRNIEFQILKCELESFDKASPKSIDDYFNKILFNGVIENTQLHKVSEQEFDAKTVEKDFLVREILYRYFNKKIRNHLIRLTFPRKFDANKLNTKTIQDVNLVRDFLYFMAAKYIDTQTENAVNTGHKTTIKFDYLKTCPEYNNFKDVLKLAKNWRCSNIKSDRIKNRDIRMSHRFAYKLMNLNNGYYVVYLGDQYALDYENRKLKHGGMVFYNDDIYEGFTRYSVRKDYTPIVTLEVYKGEVVNCYGYKNTVPSNSDLREAVRTFMRERNLTIPDNNWNKLIAYIKQDGVLYDIFNLPENLILKDTLNLEEMGLNKSPKMTSVTINGNLLCCKNNLSDLDGMPYSVRGNCDFSQNPLTSLQGIPRNVGGLILLSGHKLTAESFVPIYLEKKLKANDVLGVDKDVIEAWKKQIEIRKSGLSKIIASLREK